MANYQELTNSVLNSDALGYDIDYENFEGKAKYKIAEYCSKNRSYNIFRDADNHTMSRMRNYSLKTICISLQKQLRDNIISITVLKKHKKIIKIGWLSYVEIIIPTRLDIKTKKSGSYTIIHKGEHDFI